jgi:hypothetical protein
VSKIKDLLAAHREPPVAVPATVALAHAHPALATPATENRIAVLAVCILPLGAVRILVGELRVGFVDGCLTNRVDNQFEAELREFVVELVARNVSTEVVKRHGDRVAGTERHTCDDSVVQVQSAASRHHRFLRRTGAVDGGGAGDEFAEGKCFRFDDWSQLELVTQKGFHTFFTAEFVEDRFDLPERKIAVFHVEPF